MSDGIGKQFMLETTYKYLSPSLQREGVPQPPLQLPYDPSASVVALPVINGLPEPEMLLSTAIKERRTLRRYQDTALTLAELACLLWATQAVTSKSSPKHTLRTVPSAGARHAFETYLLINRVETLTPGIYRYLAIEHALLPLDDDPGINQRVTAACGDQSQIHESAVTFLWVAIKERMYWRYGERGYRYLHLDAGHVCQNLYLGAQGIACGVCAIAAFDDEALNSVLKLDGENQFVVYLASLGKK